MFQRSFFFFLVQNHNCVTSFQVSTAVNVQMLMSSYPV